MQKKLLHQERRNYQKDFLQIENVANNPFSQFDSWFTKAQQVGSFEANAMSISTVSIEGKPSSRIVLLKEYSERGLVFFSNYNSEKGQNLAQNKHIACLFFYEAMERQIRIEGVVQKLQDEENDAYFYSRPIESQYAAMASNQSSVLADEEELENKLQEIKSTHKKPQRPLHWGGYLIQPSYFEFWQGRPNRLHDRICFILDEANNTWSKKRLAP